jgi:hypothetical protein
MFYCCIRQAVILGSVGIAVGSIIHSHRFVTNQYVVSHHTAAARRQEYRTCVKVMHISATVAHSGKQLVHNRISLELILRTVSPQRADPGVRMALRHART